MGSRPFMVHKSYPRGNPELWEPEPGSLSRPRPRDEPGVCDGQAHRHPLQPQPSLLHLTLPLSWPQLSCSPEGLSWAQWWGGLEPWPGSLHILAPGDPDPGETCAPETPARQTPCPVIPAACGAHSGSHGGSAPNEWKKMCVQTRVPFWNFHKVVLIPASFSCSSYHGYKTMKDFVRRRCWAR